MKTHFLTMCNDRPERIFDTLDKVNAYIFARNARHWVAPALWWTVYEMTPGMAGKGGGFDTSYVKKIPYVRGKFVN